MPPLPSPSAWIFLCGMMGSGKTTVGRALAAALSGRFVDLDDRVEARAGKNIPSLFADHGEPHFRHLERESLELLLDERADARVTVVALGGGAWVQPGVADLLRPLGPTFYLQVPIDELHRRLEASDRGQRPLLIGSNLRMRLEHLLSLRAGAYEAADHTIAHDPAGQLHGVADTVFAVLRRLADRGGRMPIRALTVELGERSYPIWLGLGGADQAASLVALHCATLARRPARLFVLTDAHVHALYGQTFTDGLREHGWEVHLTVVEAGESAKSITVLTTIWSDWLQHGVGRRDVVVAFGGGVVGDLGGFAAATLLRGLTFVQVPTTILAQVDSSVGGKTGINTEHGKNLVGAFHQPSAVVMALGTLATLPREEIASGMGEVIKYGVLEGASAMGLLERMSDQIASAPPSAIDVIARCCAIKARFVAEDEREADRRALLNLGHTFGHAIEGMAGFGHVPHGAAVGLGMLLAVDAAAELELTSASDAQELYRRLFELLKTFGLPTDTTPYLQRHPEMTAWMLRDKKVAGDLITLVLPATLGDVRLCPIATERLGTLMQRLADAPLRT